MMLLRYAIAPFHPIVRGVPLSLRPAVFDRIFYQPDYNFVYFRVPKSANSTVVLSLANAMGGATGDLRGASAKRAAQNGLMLPLLSEARLDACYKFTFVRNPFTRVLSAYLDKVATGKSRFRSDLRIGDGDVSFLQFLERLDDGYLNANIHWAPQAHIVALPPSKLDFVGRTETLDDDLREVMRQIFGGDHEIVRRTDGVTSAGSRVGELYGEQERRLVRKLYARDFELFYPAM